MQAYPRRPPYHDSYSYSYSPQPPVAAHAPKPVQTSSLKADHLGMGMLLMNPRGAMPITVSKITTKQIPSCAGPPTSPITGGHAIHTAAGNHRPDETQGLLAHQSQNLHDRFHLPAPYSPTTTPAGNANSSRPSTIYRPIDGGPHDTNHNLHPLRLMPHQPPEMSEEAIIFEAIRMRDEADARHYQKEKFEQEAASKKKRVQVGTKQETLQSHVPSVKKEGEFVAPRNISHSKPVRGYDMARPEQKDPLLGRSRQLQEPGRRKPQYYHSHHDQRMVASHQSNVPEGPKRMTGQVPHEVERYHKDAYMFATPPAFEAMDEKEKERRHQSLAVEQQDLILQRVRASRAKKVGRRHQKSTQARRTT
jgi:hypothetical protein